MDVFERAFLDSIDRQLSELSSIKRRASMSNSVKRRSVMSNNVKLRLARFYGTERRSPKSNNDDFHLAFKIKK